MAIASQASIDREDAPRSPKETLPTMYDLPSEDPEKPGLPDEFHDLQPQLLSRTLQLLNHSRDHCFTASDLNLYYDVSHPLWYKRPDWFLVLRVPRLYESRDLRRSYVVWQEGQNPYVVVEFLSPGTEREDLGRFDSETAGESEDVTAEERLQPPGKWEVYEQYLRVPHYIVYSRYTQQLRYFQLEGGVYQEKPIPAENPRIWLADLEVGLGIWEGTFEDVPGCWLRWCDGEGNWLLTDTERERVDKERERSQKEQLQVEKEQLQAQLHQAVRNLLATGMEAGQVARILGLPEERVREIAD